MKPAKLRFLEAFEVVNRGHFQLSSGKHSDTYLQCARIESKPYALLNVASDLIDNNLMWKHNVTHVVAPAMGAVLIGYTLAMHLAKPFFYLERENGSLLFRRGFSLPHGARVLCVEDVITTAKTMNEVVGVVESYGATVLDRVCIINRSQDTSIKSYMQLDVPTWDPEACPLCLEGEVPASYPGSRKS